MSRIFSTLSVLSCTLLLATWFIGLTGGDLNEASRALLTEQERLVQLRMAPQTEDAELAAQRATLEDVYTRLGSLQRRATLHRLSGLLTALVVVLVNCMSVTYFIGTGRWIKEVTAAYQLNEGRVRLSSAIKRRSFPWSLGGILTVLGIAALGAAADPGTLRESTDRWVTPHYLCATAGMLGIAFALWRQYRRILENHALIETILNDVRRIREGKGLAVEADELNRANNATWAGSDQPQSA